MEEQLSLFALPPKNDSSKPHLKKAPPHHASEWSIYIDGASRGNPGPAGAGIKIVKDDKTSFGHSFFLGKKTNNQAEYFALLLGLLYFKKALASVEQKPEKISIISDSELLIKQMNNEYKVKNPNLLLLYNFILELLDDNFKYKFTHVTRDKNVEADALANKAIDKKHKIPQTIISKLSERGIET